MCECVRESKLFDNKVCADDNVINYSAVINQVVSFSEDDKMRLKKLCGIEKAIRNYENRHGMWKAVMKQIWLLR
eukprot:6693041-Karenia_brevis.AAC.1